MGVSSAVHWWEEWQLRILVLGSLFVQFLLLISAALRKLAIPSWFRSIIWLAYLGSDALAIYALATLFTRQRKIDCSSVIGSQKDCSLSTSNSVLEVVWAPVLLIHLGGRDLITAYNIEDNELWKRHVVTSVSQVAVAIYVFCRTWRGSDRRLLQAAILLFIPGVLKCIEKPVALMSASINSLVSSSGTVLRTGSSLEGYVIEASSFVSSVPEHTDPEQPEAHGDGDAEELRQGNFVFVALLQLLKAMWTAIFFIWKRSFLWLRAWWTALCLFWWGERSLLQRLRAWWTRLLLFWQCDGSLLQRLWALWTAFLLAHLPGDVVDSLPPQILRPSSMFVDLSYPYPQRLSILKCFFVLDGKGACDLLQGGLSNMFDLLYTKEYSSLFCSNPKEHPYQFLFGALVRGVSLYLPFAAIGLFHYSHREDYNHRDVKITYVLLCCTAVLEVYSIVGKQYVRPLETSFKTRLSAKAAQHSLIGLFACHERHPQLMCLASSFKCKNYVDQHWCKKSCSSSGRITELVLEHVKGWWKGHINAAASYRKFSNHRGQWTINKYAGLWEVLSWSLERPFDESVLIWHMATDLCFHFKGASNQHRCAADQCAHRTSDDGCATWCQGSPYHERAKLCTEMSNYMIYLLFVNPEMLLAGTRRNLFTTAYGELKERLKGEEILLQKRAVAQKIITKMQPPQVLQEGFIIEPEGPQEGFIIEPEGPQEGFIIEPEGPQEDFIQDAWKLTEVLLTFNDEQMWKVIEGVWVEMLCFSASRCRGYLHAKSLAMGGELLTLVWLLLSHMGMETLSERLQMTELEFPRSAENNV